MVLSSPIRLSSSSTAVAGIVEVMIGFANVRSSGSMVFASVTHGLLARPRPCKLHMCLHLMWGIHRLPCE
jgi:hypothetical protein